jgi:putative FmdB family regulatory protein
MPLYEYECEKCGDQFEVMQKFSDEPLKIHEKCGGPVHRLLSAPALQFKGSGWYITDYAKGGNSSTNGDTAKKPGASESSGSDAGASKSTTESSGSSDTKSESKPSSSTTSSDKK